MSNVVLYCCCRVTGLSYLFPLSCGSGELSVIVSSYTNTFNVCPFDYTAIAVSGKVERS